MFKSIIEDSKYVEQTPMYRFRNGENVFNEDELKELLIKNGSIIKYIKNPSEQLQFIAVKNYPQGIVYIENPSEKLQITAVKNLIKAGKSNNISNKLHVYNDLFVMMYIKSQKALELYEQLKRT
jgi:hypothetical protein